MTKNLADVIMEYLYSNGGVCLLTDKSPVDDIYQAFHVSKKNYKKAIGDLYKRRLITIGDDSIRLVVDAPKKRSGKH